MLGQRGLAASRQAVEAQRAVAAPAQRLDDARHRIAGLDVQQVQVVAGDHRAGRLVARRRAAQGLGGVAELPLDQQLQPRRARRVPGVAGRQPREAHRGADLRRRQVAALGQPGGEAGLDVDAGQRTPDQPFARPRWRRLQLQVVLEAAAEGRVDLLDAIRDPDHGHRVGLEDLVDPGLAADAAAGRGVAAVQPREQLRRLAGQRREDILDLVEQQRDLAAALQEDLADLQAAVPVAARQRVAVAVGMLHLVERQPGSLRADLRKLGLAGARRTVQQHVDAGFAARDGVLQQRGDHVDVVGDEGEVRGRQLRRPSRPREDRHQVVGLRVLAHQHRRQLLADLHQVGQVGDVVFRDQVLDHAGAFQPRSGAQRLGNLAGVHAGHLGDRRVGLLGAGHLEFDEQPTQLALVARERPVEQQRALGRVQLQQAGQRVDVLLHQRRLPLQARLQPVARDGQHGQQVLRGVLDVLVHVEEQRPLLVRAAPDAVALEEFQVGQGIVPAPVVVAAAAQLQEAAHAAQHTGGPDDVAPGQAEQAVAVAPDVEARRLAQRQREHEVRAQAIEDRRLQQARRGHAGLRALRVTALRLGAVTSHCCSPTGRTRLTAMLPQCADCGKPPAGQRLRWPAPGPGPYNAAGRTAVDRPGDPAAGRRLRTACRRRVSAAPAAVGPGRRSPR